MKPQSNDGPKRSARYFSSNIDEGLHINHDSPRMINGSSKMKKTSYHDSARLQILESELFRMNSNDSSSDSNDKNQLEFNEANIIDLNPLTFLNTNDDKTINLNKGFHKQMFHKLNSTTVAEYESKLRDDYSERIPACKWNLPISESSKKQDKNTKSNDDINQDERPLSRQKRTHIIRYKAMKNLNFSNQHTLKVTSIDFFQTSNISLTASIDQRLTIYKADDLSNELLHSLFMKRYPILSAHFLKNNEKIVFNSLFNNFCHFDMAKEHISFVKLPKKDKRTKLKFSILSNSDILALISDDYTIDIFCTKSSAKICSFRSSNTISDSVFDNQSQSLVSVSQDTDKINIWDMRSQKIRSQLSDITSNSNTSVALSPKQKLLCIGTLKGPVSAYSLKNDINVLESGNIESSKVFSNLKTACNGIKFSNKTNLMVSYSSLAKNSIKLLNCSAKVMYSNFLVNEKSTCTVATFSPNGTAIYLGTAAGSVKVYSFPDLI